MNAQESIAFEYSRANYNAYLAFEADNPYRASDHNPEIIGLNLITPITQPPVGPSAQPSTQASANPSAPAGNPEQSASATKAKQKRSKLASTGVNETIPLALGALVLGVIACAMRRRTL